MAVKEGTTDDRDKSVMGVLFSDPKPDPWGGGGKSQLSEAGEVVGPSVEAVILLSGQDVPNMLFPKDLCRCS